MSRLWRNLCDEEQAELVDNSPKEPDYTEIEETEEPSGIGEHDGLDDEQTF